MIHLQLKIQLLMEEQEPDMMFSENQYAFLKAPLELAVDDFRDNRAYNEKQLSSILKQFTTLRRGRGLNKVYALEQLQQMRQRLISLKQKMTEDFEKQKQTLLVIPKRIHYIVQSEIDPQEYFKTKMNIQIVEFLALNRKFMQAEELAKSLKVQGYSNCQIRLVGRYWAIIDQLRNHYLHGLRNWVKQHKKVLRDKKSELEFKVVVMFFIQFLKAEQMEKALTFIRQQDLKSMYISEKNQQEFTKAMGVLVFGDAFKLAYPHLFHEGRWTELEQFFQEAYFIVYKIDFQSHLENSMAMGMSIIKTPHCQPIQEGRPPCPMCDQLFFNLSKNVPMLFRHSSHIICRITKEQINQDNPAFMFPNGQVFSKKAIDSFEKLGTQVICPISNKMFSRNSIRRLYLI